MGLPAQFVWTKYGSEAGESADAVLLRKEKERASNKGLYLWGIGNSVAPAVRHLMSSNGGVSPAVVFSPMKSAARKEDAAPRAVARWTHAVGLDGKAWAIPEASMVTSRLESSKGEKRRHYALVCQLDSPLVPDRTGPRFSMSSLCNFASGAPVGASQVTSVVRHAHASDKEPGDYVAAVVATLVYPFVLELSEPVCLDGRPLARSLERQYSLLEAAAV